jgi:hypothetical protein
MGCCGKKVRVAAHKARNIIEGNVRALLGEESPIAAERRTICKECEEATWFSGPEFVGWAMAHGVSVFEHFADLDALPKLPKQEKDENRQRLFCRVCKCPIKAKSLIEDEECLLGRWPA